MHFLIKAFWDSEASVWVASSDDELGLVAEAKSLDALVAKIRELVPELVELNGLTPETDACPYDLLVQDSQAARASA
ncbi:MAG: DUF1902 domain-containing protein [Salinisphaera sp.]|nr:DUF1902 domain-containing protein [Salinisphaera sp.]